MAKTEHKYIGYMDGTDFFYEEGRPIDGNRFFAEPDQISQKCVKDCGIAKVEIRFLGWHQKPTDPRLSLPDDQT